MSWLDTILKRLPNTELQVINDAKSPSGTPHVGALRGVLIHDAVYKFLKERGINVKNIYGSDDYDPMDELPGGQTAELYDKYLGAPLSNVPAPAGSAHKDVAMHYISDFLKIFDEIGAEAEFYYMRDYYKNGFFNEAIETLLNKADVVRDIYKKVSNSDRPKDWYPAQVVCEKCGKLGTTQIVDWDGKEATYVCRPDMVTWATGCGHKGKISPFDGNGKLPYKVEWASKWKYMGITIEGAGMDHNTRGGSRDVADAVSRQIFDYQPPINIPYGFFLLGGAKMSSSKGVGTSARAMANFLPPEILRYLMLGTQPKRTVNFEPSEKNITKVFNDFDKLHRKVHTGEPKDFEKQTYNISQVFTDENYWTAEFPLIVTLLQLPHIDLVKQAEKLKGSPLTEAEKTNLQQRAKSAQYWLDNFASDEEKIEIQEKMPERAKELDVEQRAFLRKYSDLINDSDWSEKSIQSAIFNAARLTPIDNKKAFTSVYRVLLDKEKGPKAGNLIAYMEKDFITKRFNELELDQAEFWQKTAITKADFEKWKSENDGKIKEMNEEVKTSNNLSVTEVTATLNDGKTYMKRILS